MIKSNRQFMLPDSNHGFSIIEALIAVSIFGIAFLAFSNGIWSASKSTRITFFADESIMAGQDIVETSSAMDIREVKSTSPGEPIQKENQKIILNVIDTTDTDGDGVADFKTIAVRVYHSRDDTLSPDELRMKSYYRRRIY